MYISQWMHSAIDDSYTVCFKNADVTVCLPGTCAHSTSRDAGAGGCGGIKKNDWKYKLTFQYFRRN